ncbi:hypothetical protein [Ruania zhangjianzhongii]|uniref:hypothetical protein n=1 Tax=Ruania zhangjianzhongii TaxID=2603206 RepID=UPI0011C73E9F|nr:hypothetical protein [Ruania zhangjianzhongii]
MSARVRGVAIGVMVIAALITGCGSGTTASEQSGEPNEPGQSGQSGESPAAGDLPDVDVLTTPDGFEDVAPDQLSTEWTPLVTGEDCVLVGRAGQSADPVEDLRAASVAAVRDIASAGGADPAEVTDLELVTSGSGEGNDPAATATFASADWTGDSGAVRAASRVQNLLSYEGTGSSERLDLTFTCTDGSLDDAAWEAVMADVRPSLSWGSEEPWRDILEGVDED